MAEWTKATVLKSVAVRTTTFITAQSLQRFVPKRTNAFITTQGHIGDLGDVLGDVLDD